MLESGKLEIGLNYWASENASRMWKHWNAASVEKDLKALDPVVAVKLFFRGGEVVFFFRKLVPRKFKDRVDICAYDGAFV